MKIKQSEMRWEFSLIWVVAGFIVASTIDYLVGIEIRVYPLYFLPLSFAAWRFGKRGAIPAVFTATTLWVLCDWSAGLHYSTDEVWIINTLSQALAFGTVAMLFSWARKLLEREQTLSCTDSLTGLPNARAFHSAVNIAVAACRRNQRPLIIAYLDLDNFKCVNDCFGHLRGDALLCDVANILRTTLRATDRSARIGGDEFVVCLPETTALQAEALLERLRAALAAALPANECAISASIGAFCWDVPPEDVDAMISAADNIMYEVKKNGKNRVEIVNMSAD